MEDLMQLTAARFITAIFEEHLPEFSKNKRRIATCTIERAPLSISSNRLSRDIPSLSILYRLAGSEAGNETGWVQMVYGKVLPAGPSRDASQSRQSKLSAQSGRDGKIVHFSGYDLVLWVFPNDPALSQLPTCLDPHQVTSYFPYDALLEDVKRPDDLTAVTTRVLNYLPEDRCTIRYDFRWGQVSAPGKGKVIGKTFSDNRGSDLFKLMQQIWDRSCQNPEAFMVAQPLSYNETLRTFWQGFMPGTPVLDLLNHTNCQKLSEAIAKGLAHFHRGQLSSFATVHNRGILTETVQKTAELMQALPSLRKPLQLVLSQIQNVPPSLDSVPPTPIHGSFRIKEIIAQDGRLGLFDFDNCTFGDPIRDVGVFIADLHRRRVEASLITALTTGFLHAYREHVKWDVPFDAVNWHFRTRLLEKAYWRLENRWFNHNFEKRIREIVGLAEKGAV